MRRTGVTALLALGLIGRAPAHRLDEYLQATLIGVTRDGTDVEIRLTPGVAMLPVLMAVIDQDRDGTISCEEERAYVARVIREVELRVDGVPAPLSLVESKFPTLEAMHEGLGTIAIKLRTARNGHELRFENRHLPQVSAYLVNCLAAPSDGLVVSRQVRDELQRSIAFEYGFGAGAAPAPRAAWVALGMLLAARWGWRLACQRARGRGRDGRYRPPPAQIRASAPNAHGSYLGCFDAKRTSG
jgi:hypothetical protein